MSIPEAIKQHKPTEYGPVSIRYLHGQYYVYVVTSIYDRETKKTKKITGKMVGKITEEDGFIPNRNGRSVQPPNVYLLGPYRIIEACCRDITQELEDNLQPKIDLLKMVICMRIINPMITFEHLDILYERSFFRLLKKEKFTSETMRSLLEWLGRHKSCVDQFRYSQKAAFYAREQVFFPQTVKDKLEIYNASYKQTAPTDLGELEEKGYRALTEIVKIYIYALSYKMMQTGLLDHYSLADIIGMCEVQNYVKDPGSKERISVVNQKYQELIRYMGCDLTEGGA